MALDKIFVLVKLAFLCCGTFLSEVCLSQEQQQADRGDTVTEQYDCSEQVNQLTTRLDDIFDEMTKLKKVSLATLNLIASPEQGQCMQPSDLCDLSSSVGGSNCRFLGTANYPALSCEQLLNACQASSGVYYIQGGHATFHKLYCDMESFDGGWARFGSGDMGSVWNYLDEDEDTVTLDIISESDIEKMKTMYFTEFRILTDVQFWLQADDSLNPSLLSVNFLPSLSAGEMFIDLINADHTHLVLDDERDHVTCHAGGSSRCGHGGTPAVGAKSQQLFIRSAFFGPRANGATAYRSEWRRNKYSWNGAYYYVLAK